MLANLFLPEKFLHDTFLRCAGFGYLLKESEIKAVDEGMVLLGAAIWIT